MASPKKSAPKKTAARKPAAKSAKPTNKAASAKKSSAKKSATPRREVLLAAPALKSAVAKLCARIAEEFPTPERLLILGIRTRGALLAERITANLSQHYGVDVASGILDITFYRDDLSRLGPNPMVRGSEFPFDLTDSMIVLVDDVLFTGRTVRAALDEISDFGRPALIRLAVLVDRGLREYPIHADYCAVSIPTATNQRVHVLFDEVDDEDAVVLETV